MQKGFAHCDGRRKGALVSPAGSVGVQCLPLANNTPLETPPPFVKGGRKLYSREVTTANFQLLPRELFDTQTGAPLHFILQIINPINPHNQNNYDINLR